MINLWIIIYNTVIAFWALKLLNIKLLTSNFCTPLNWRVKMLRFCNQKERKKKNTCLPKLRLFIAVLARKRDFMSYKPLKIRAYSRNTERPLIIEVLADTTIIHNQVLLHSLYWRFDSCSFCSFKNTLWKTLLLL